jgi:hypothetical protein
MGKQDKESIADTVKRAREMPDDLGGGANVPLPSLFGQFPIPEGEPIVDNLPHPNARRASGLPKYNLEAHLERFVVGKLFMEIGDRVEVEEIDDSANYEKLLNRALQGEAIIRWEEKQTLKDGTFVITVCYLTVKEQPKKPSHKPSDN